MRSLLLLALLSSSVFAEDKVSPIDKLQNISVTIEAKNSQGSGTLYTRKVDDKNITFVWTAAHVVDGLRRTREIVDSKTGTKRDVVEFEDAKIIKEFSEKGRRIGEMKFDAKVLLSSESENGEDLALLMVRKPNYSEETTQFYLEDKIPPIGTELYHVGSLLGQVGANSLTTGIISQIGRVLDLNADGTVFDQTTVTAFPGSSGGGVFLKENTKYVGMLVRGSGEQFNLIVPVRRIIKWAKDANIEWAVNPEKPMPTMEEILKIKPEYNAVQFEKLNTKPTETEFPFLIKRIKPFEFCHTN